jgi:hypothetical protein
LALALVVWYLDRTKNWRVLAAVMTLPSILALFVAVSHLQRSEPWLTAGWVLIAVLWLLFPLKVLHRRTTRYKTTR